MCVCTNAGTCVCDGDRAKMFFDVCVWGEGGGGRGRREKREERVGVLG